ncbi:MAG TPA: DNA internalization-related competence protein ComEC/Rec2 [Casimicrobiaceae bacterium]|nr:DNA internalization-related competence protein ComEC/Rec2 [Casimicrobiaceae bacterium]
MRLLLLAFALGVLALQQQQELPRLAWGATIAAPLLLSLTAVFVAHRRAGRIARSARALAFIAAVAAVALAGFFYAAWRAELRLADELPSVWEGRDIELSGVIDELPQASDRGTRFAFAVERVLTEGAVVPSRLSLAWYASWYGEGPRDEVPALRAGERWQFVVRLKRPHGTINPHGFDLEAWLLQNDLRATGYVRTDDANRRLDAFAGRPGDYVQRLRESIRNRILSALDGRPYAGVIAALAIGDERAIPSEQWRVFFRTGIGHLISISGLHVTAFATLIGALVFWLWRRSHALTLRLPARKAAAVAGVLAAFIYVLLAGFQIPAQRTLYMLAVAAIGLWIGRPGTASAVWLWALAVVLAFDPWAMLTPGFWLSFGAVGVLLYTGVGRIGDGSTLKAAARAQWAVTLGLVPLMLMLFQQISLVSPLANAIAIPVVTFIVVPLTLASIALPWDGLLVVAHTVFAWLAAFLEYLSALPSAVWEQHAPSAWAIAAGLLGVLWLLAPRGVPGRALGGVWLVPLFVIAPLLPPPGAFRVVVLDVGQGLAVLVQTHAHALLYDTGPRFNETADAGNRIIAPMLRATGVTHLDGMIVSHQDIDHSGGALSLIDTVPVDWLASSLPEENRILRARAAQGEPAHRCLAGERWSWDGVEFSLLHPVEANYANPKLKTNDLSCVLRVRNAAGTALLTGDIEARTEADLIRRDAASLGAELLVVPHHGSRSSSTPGFITAVSPRIAVFTPGYRNRFGHPRPEIVDRYAKARIPTYRTDYDGALSFAFEPGVPLAAIAQRDIDRRYWYDAPVRSELPPLD